MADGTSDTSDPAVESAEPSMEDILASIRQLIADDSVDATATVTPAVILDANTDEPLELVDSLDDSLADSPLDDMLARLDDTTVASGDAALDIPDIPEIQLVDDIEAAAEPLSDDLMDLDVPSDSKADIDINEAILEAAPASLMADTLAPKSSETESLSVESLLEDEASDGQVSDDEFSIDSLLDDIAVQPVDDQVSAEALSSNDDSVGDLEPPSDPISEIDDIDGLMDELTAELDVSKTDAVPVLDAPAEDFAVDDLSLEAMLDDTPDVPVVADVLEDDMDVDIGLSPESAASDGVSDDPDIELVKSLMAELSDTPSLDDASLMDEISPEVELPDTAVSGPDLLDSALDAGVTSEAEQAMGLDDVIDDIISDADKGVAEDISALETGSSDDSVTDIAFEDLLKPLAEPETVNETTDKPRSALSALADEIDGAQTLTDGVSGAAVGAGVVAAVSGAAAAVVAAPKVSALDSLINNDVSVDDAEDDVQAVNFDDIVSDMISQPELAEEDQNLGAALEALLDDEPADLDVGTEIDVPQIDAIEPDTADIDITEADVTEINVIDEIIEDSSETLVDPSDKIIETRTDNAQTEIANMARKTANNTILDEVTETAAASAFASLTNVVEEKAVVAERGDRIGDLVSEALQPMLKEWLDKNLKGIVERAVTKEVKRISTGK